MRISLCLGILLALFNSVKGEEWRGIKPLCSTRADVEQILGQPLEANGRVYRLENEWATVTYSDGVCSQEFEDWDVPKDTVLSISVRSGLKLFSELKVDSAKFVKIHEHIQAIFYYKNKEDGILYYVNGDYINAVLYFPSAKDNRLLCPKVEKKNTTTQ